MLLGVARLFVQQSATFFKMQQETSRTKQFAFYFSCPKASIRNGQKGFATDIMKAHKSQAVIIYFLGYF